MDDTTAPRQLSLLPSSAVPVQFRLDADTRRRGLRHIAEIRAQLATRQAARDFTWVEFYPADSLTEMAARNRTADGLRDELSERCDLDSVAAAHLRDDPAGKLVLVRGNRHIHQTIGALQSNER